MPKGVTRKREAKLNLEEVRGRKLGRILIKMQKMTRDQVQEGLDLQQQRRMPIGQVLIELGYATQADINAALAAQAGMETLDLDRLEIDEETIRLLPAETADAYKVMPLKYEKATNTLTVALSSADNFRAVDDLHLLMGFNVKTVVADPEQVEEYIHRHYLDTDESMASLIGEIEEDRNLSGLLDERDQSMDLDAQIAASEDNKVKRLMSLVLMQAIRDHASDVHFEPFEDEFKMRYRVDGVMYEMIPPPKYLASAITSRVKVMANLDIAERRLPQDGRIELVVANNPVDLRVSCLPTMFGESVVMRVLDRTNVNLKLENCGLRADELKTTRGLMHKPNGIVLVTGPTGSGKTTTLYAALSELNQTTEKILTAEDPVEYDIDGLVQIQINEDIGMTFARAMRSFLRQDPDVILVGEIRDLETAQIAIQAALTGHLVFSTLHTNDAPSSVARLLDLGIEPFLLTATVEGIVAQRLVRKVCNKCKQEYTPTEEELMELQLTEKDLEGQTLYRGKGCDKCNQTGFKGRKAIYEIMVLDEEIKELVMQSASTSVLRDDARKRGGMKSLRESGLEAIFMGETTIDEVVRETVLEEG